VLIDFNIFTVTTRNCQRTYLQ